MGLIRVASASKIYRQGQVSFPALDDVSLDIEKGEFTLEDEIRIAISVGSAKRLKDLTDLFEGKSTEHYPALGKVDDSSRRRSTLANLLKFSML